MTIAAGYESPEQLRELIKQQEATIQRLRYALEQAHFAAAKNEISLVTQILTEALQEQGK